MASVNFTSGTVIPNAWAVDVNSLVWGVFNGATTAALARTALGLGTAALSAATSFASSGLATASGLTQSTGKLLGRTTASTGAIEEITPGATLAFSGGALTTSFAPITNSIAGNVSLSNTGTFFDGPTIAQGTVGTWFVSGSVVLGDSAGGAVFDVKLWDATTVIASALVQILNANNVVACHLSGFIVSPAASLRISVKDTSSTSGSIIANSFGAAKDSTITAIRIA